MMIPISQNALRRYHLHLVSAQGASDSAGSAGSDLASLRTSRAITSHSSGLTHVLLVTTSVRVVHRVHRHTSDLGPLVSLDSVLVESTTGLQDGLVGSAAASDQTNHGSARVGDGLLRAGRKSDSGNALLGILGHNDGVVSGCSGQFAAVADLRLDVADHGSLRDLSNRQDVADGQTSCRFQSISVGLHHRICETYPSCRRK